MLICHGELTTSSSLEPTELPQYQAALQWCVAHGFELIWWEQGAQRKENSAQQGGLLNEQTGIDRIREALQAHTWPSMTMKHDQTKMDIVSCKVKDKTTVSKPAKDEKNEDLQSREIIGKDCHRNFGPI